jgi:phospho-N-acetylmuramoyl-pentapeptide-transferase
MLYWLSSLRDVFFGFNLFRYITVRAVGSGLTAFFVAVLCAPLMIRWLEQRQYKQYVRSDAAAGGLTAFHEQKAGTPTMGGLLMLGAIVLAVLLWGDLTNHFLLIATGAMMGLGLVGLADDVLKLRSASATGLPCRYKLLLQMCIGMAVGYVIVALAPQNTWLEVPLIKLWSPNIGWWYVPFAALVVVASSNAVNLTDGLDGLASGCLALAGSAYGVLAYITSHTLIAQYLDVYFTPAAGELSVLCAALVGACLGFLWYNAYPASLFMGDTGALGLGGVLGVIALFIKKEILLLIVGGIFVVEALSVIVQVASYRYRNQQRIFLMAPIHHHFQMKGWSEPKVTVRFWIVGAVLALLSVASLKVR